jgi:hypothetical protein
MMETKTLKRFSTNSDVKMEVNSISDYLKPNMPLPQYLPYARFLLDTDLSHTAKLLYTLLDRATRKWSCLLNNFHRTKNNPNPSQCSTPTLDEWSAFATFLADVIEKYASVLEIDNAVSSTNNKNRQDTVDAALAS